MSARVERAVPAVIPRTREVVVGFVPEEVRAPFLLRCGALLIDYIVIIMMPVLGLLLSRFAGYDGANLLTAEPNSAGWIIAVLVAISDLVLLPMFSGRTIGKLATGLRIVKLDGTTPSFSAMAWRQIGGYFLTLASAGIGFFISVFSSKGRALHDYLAGTVVIYADKRSSV